MKNQQVKVSIFVGMFAILVLSCVSTSQAATNAFLGVDPTQAGYTSLDKDLFPSNPNLNLTVGVDFVNANNLQTLYIALENWSWDTTKAYAQGTAPIQLLLQHFNAPGGKEIVALNTFTGLIAWRDNSSLMVNRPDVENQVYYGWMMYGELMKNYTNDILIRLVGVPPQFALNPNVIGTAQHIPVSQVGNTYRFGMVYRNLFTVWREIEDAEEFNNTDSIGLEFLKPVAWSVFSSINFTYIISATDLGNGTMQVNTTSQYQIGPITDLWIQEDEMANASEFIGATIYQPIIAGFPIVLAHYNTTALIENRLNGTTTTSGFGLGVTNFGRIMELNQNSTTDDTSWVDEHGDGVNDMSDKEVTHLSAKVAAATAQAYGIDFASKPTYLWNGVETLPSPTYVFPKSHIEAPLGVGLWRFVKGTLHDLWMKSALGKYQSDWEDDNAAMGSYAYITVFPKWWGLSCVQDPTFTAFVNISGIDAFPLMFVGLAAIPALIYLARKYRR